MNIRQAFEKLFSPEIHDRDPMQYFLRGRVKSIREDYLSILAGEQLAQAYGILPEELHFLIKDKEDIIDDLEETEMGLVVCEGFLFKIPDNNYSFVELSQVDSDEDDDFEEDVEDVAFDSSAIELSLTSFMEDDKSIPRHHHADSIEGNIAFV